MVRGQSVVMSCVISFISSKFWCSRRYSLIRPVSSSSCACGLFNRLVELLYMVYRFAFTSASMHVRVVILFPLLVLLGGGGSVGIGIGGSRGG